MHQSYRIRRALEVLAGVVILGAGFWAIHQFWQAAESQWCRWRLNRMNSCVLTPEEMGEDIDELYDALLERHPAPFEHISEIELQNSFENTRDAIREDLTRHDFFTVVAPLVSSIGCGHTALRPPRGWIGLLAKGGWVLPLGIRIVDGRAYVVEEYGDDQMLQPGSEISAINGCSTVEIRDQLLTVLSADGPDRAFALAQLNDFFFFQHAKFFGPERSYRLEVTPPGAVDAQTVVVKGVLAKTVAEAYWVRHPVRDVRSSVYPVHGEVLIGQKAAYLWVPTFDVGKARGFKTVLQDFFEKIRREQVDTLVVDVRGNNGGPSTIAVELLKYLISTEFQFLRLPEDSQQADLPVFKHYAGSLHPFADALFDGALYVLIDGGCFSTTGHFCAALGANREVIFVGDRTGGGSRCHDNGELIELSNSGLALRVATTTFDIDVPNDSRSICPDIPISPTIDDLVAGRDTVLAELGERLGLDLESAAVRLAQTVGDFPDGV